MTTAHVLLNPAARGGRNRALRPAVERALREAGLAVEVLETARPGDAERLARALGEAGALVVSAGGDGTVHEIANGLAGTAGTLAVLPLGTGNDFAHALGMPDDLAQAAGVVARGQSRRVDLGHVRWTDADGGTHERRFANCLGAGFDAHAAALAAQTKRLGGRTAYLVAVVRTLWAWRRPRVHVRVRERVPAGDAGDAPSPLDHDGPLFLCEVGNGHSVGGGFLLTPDAVPDDGLLDVCLVRHVTTRRALRLLPRTFTGAHVTAPEVTMGRTTGLGLTVEGGGVALQADGEILTYHAVEAEVTVEPAALAAVVGAMPRGRASGE